ncbi:MAG: diguanylate cyclase [Deltaproteobacteria bacterium]|nr:diguanylate cyclase [Deltaproteobacteria bacterium]
MIDDPILIVEDDPVSGLILEKLLVKAGYQVVLVREGQAALNILAERFIPLIITDWMMPGMDGLALCRTIRSGTYPGYVYVILLTGKDTKQDLVQGLEAGADDYITKPFNPNELLARLNTARRILEMESSLRRAAEEIQRLSILDPLTQVYNRLYLNFRLPQEISRSQRYGTPLALVLCDLDHFKEVNDQYGHLTGDRVLAAFARCLEGCIREGIDWVSRFGGEEFLIVLPQTPLEGACLVGERMRERLGELGDQNEMGRIRVTASFGVTGWPGTGSTPTPPSLEGLIQKADEALYRAKQEGRDRVCCLPDSLSEPR